MLRQKSLVFSLFLAIIFFSYASYVQGGEQITLTTYYPSPLGVYRNLRFFPTGQTPCNANSRGTVYYDDIGNNLNVCTQTGWTVIGSGGSGGAGGDFWTLNVNNLYPVNLTNSVGVGINPLIGGLNVNNTPATLNKSIGLQVTTDRTGSAAGYALRASASGATWNYGLQFAATGGTVALGVQGSASNATGLNMGIWGGATSPVGSTPDNYGVRTYVQGGNTNYGVFTQADSANLNNYSIYSIAFGNTGTKYGLYSLATGSNTNYGVYTSASGGTTNWGLYVNQGNTYLGGNLQLAGGMNITMGYEIRTNNFAGYVVEATCTAGKRVIGGGCRTQGNGVTIYDSFPVNNTTWHCGYAGLPLQPIIAYAICANIQ